MVNSTSPIADDDFLAGLDPMVQAVIVACATYIIRTVATYFSDKKQRKADKKRLRNTERLKRIEFQIAEVFGPLRGLILQTQAAFTILLKRHKYGFDEGEGKDAKAFFGELMKTDHHTTEETLSPVQRDWIYWLKYILQPANRQMVVIIMGKSAGFNVMPQFLAALTAHIAEHDVILAKIELGRYDHLVSTVPWDNRMGVFVNTEYKNIVERKDEILGNMENDYANVNQKSAGDYDNEGGGITLDLVSGDTEALDIEFGDSSSELFNTSM